MLKQINNHITDRIEQKLNVKRASARAYASQIRRLFREMKRSGELKLSFLDSDAVVTHLKGISNVARRKNMAAAALAGARTAELSQKRMNSIREVMMQSDADYKRFMTSGIRNKGFTGSAEKLWKELKGLHRKVGRVLTARGVFKRKDHSFADMQTLQFFVYCKLLSVFEPRRLEYAGLRFLTPEKLALFKPAEQKGMNYILQGRSKWTIVWNKYKTSKTYGTQTYDLPTGLRTTLRRAAGILEARVPAGYIFFTKNNRVMSHSTFSKFLKDNFKTYMGKAYTQNTVRSIRVSALFKDAAATKELMDAQKGMASKLETLALNYRVPQ